MTKRGTREWLDSQISYVLKNRVLYIGEDIPLMGKRDCKTVFEGTPDEIIKDIIKIIAPLTNQN